jgi:carbon storage regulator CsrA
MLALTRRIGEEVVIGDPAKPIGVIRVVAVHGDKVRLSFDFPRDVKINRKELADLKAKGIPPAGPGAAAGGAAIPGNGSDTADEGRR